MTPTRSMREVLLSSAVLLAGVTGCAQPPNATPQLLAAATVPRLLNYGQSAYVHVSATNEVGSPGSGTVTVTAAAGAFQGGVRTATIELVQGQGDAVFTCDVGHDPACVGSVHFDAQWDKVTAQFDLPLGPPPSDGGTYGIANTRSLVVFDGDPDNEIHPGHESWDGVTRPIFATTDGLGGDTPLKVAIEVNDGDVDGYYINMDTYELGFPFRPGNYLDAVSGKNSEGYPGLEVHGSGRTCSAVGQFTVYSVAFDGPFVRSLDADFQLHCGSDPALLRGWVWFNARRPTTSLDAEYQPCVTTPNVLRLGIDNGPGTSVVEDVETPRVGSGTGTLQYFSVDGGTFAVGTYNGTPLTPGTYKVAGTSVDGKFTGLQLPNCGTAPGSFKVFDVEGDGGTLDRLSVSFNGACSPVSNQSRLFHGCLNWTRDAGP